MATCQVCLKTVKLNYHGLIYSHKASPRDRQTCPGSQQLPLEQDATLAWEEIAELERMVVGQVDVPTNPTHGVVQIAENPGRWHTVSSQADIDAINERYGTDIIAYTWDEVVANQLSERDTKIHRFQQVIGNRFGASLEDEPRAAVGRPKLFKFPRETITVKVHHDDTHIVRDLVKKINMARRDGNFETIRQLAEQVFVP